MRPNIQVRLAKDAAFKVLLYFMAFAITVPLFLILLYILKEGITKISWHFFVNVPKPVGELGGGIANALVGSLLMVLVASVISIPIGVMTGIYLSENQKGTFAYWVGLCVDILQGVPSIVIGIVVYFWFIQPFSAIAGSVALAIMMLPIMIRATEETLKLLPDSLKEAAFALGIPYHRVIMRVVVPCGFAGILSGIMLSVARVAGETAPLLFTAFGNPYLSFDMSKPMQSLPLLIYNYATSPYDDWHDLAWGASVILLLWVLLLNIITKISTRKWNIQL